MTVGFQTRHPLPGVPAIEFRGLRRQHPALIRGIIAIGWFGIQTMIMAFAIDGILIALFGDKYRACQKQVPFLLPYGFLKPQIRKEGAPRL
jgi:hypothetical protein